MNVFQRVMKKDMARVMSGKVTNAEAAAILEKTKFPNYMAAELQGMVNAGLVTDDMPMEVQREMIGKSFKKKQADGELQWPLYDWFVEFFGHVKDDEHGGEV